MNETPTQSPDQGQEHNPYGLTPEVYGAPVYRLLRKGERVSTHFRDEIWLRGYWTKSDWLGHEVGSDNSTYRRRVAPEPTAEQRIAEPFVAACNDAAHLAEAQYENLEQERRDHDAAIARIAELEREAEILQRNLAGAVDNEQERWQDALDKLFARLLPDASLDGGGCDSGDPLDFSIAEISQAIQHVESKAESELAQLRARIAELERTRDGTVPYEELAQLRAVNAKLERELTIERGESAETSRILHEQDEDVKRLTMERDEARRDCTIAVETLKDKCKTLEAQLAASEKDREVATELLAMEMYDDMRRDDEEGARFPWVPKGNSLKQEEARHKARAAIDAAKDVK